MSTFQERHTFEERCDEAARILKKYPNRVPVIVETNKHSPLEIDKCKYLVPKHITVGEMIFIIRKRISITPEQSIFLFINNNIPSSTKTLIELYDQYKSKCGYLYITISTENTFG